MVAERQQAFGQPRQIPGERVRLTTEGVEPAMVEIRRHKARIVSRDESPGAVVEALAGDVDVVGVEHAMHKPGGDPVGTGAGYALRHFGEEALGPGIVPRCGDARHIGRKAVVEEPRQALGILEKRQALEGADTQMAVAQPHQHRCPCRRWLVMPLEFFAGLDQAQRFAGVDAERLEHRSRQHLAHAALQRQPTIAATRPRRAARALGAEIEQAVVIKIVQLRKQETAAVAEIGIVRLELVAVIAQRQRFAERAGNRGEAAEMVDPFGVAQPIEPDARRRPLIAVAQRQLWKLRRPDRIVERGSKLQMGRRRARTGHRLSA